MPHYSHDSKAFFLVVFSALSGFLFLPVLVSADSTVSALDSNDPYNWLVKSVCVDAQNNLLRADPYDGCPNGSSIRKIRVGEPLPYHNRDQRGVQQRDSFPIQDLTGNILIVANFDHYPYNSFTFSGGTDGYDVYAIKDGWVSAHNTSDGGGYGTTFFGKNCSIGGGWGLFPSTGFLAGGQAYLPIAGVYWEQSGQDFPGACPSGYTNDSLTEWELKTAFPFGDLNYGRKIMDTMISYHGFQTGNYFLNDGHIEVFYFTKEYGITRWEVWTPVAQNKTGDATACSGSPTRNYKGISFVVTDCRDWTDVILASSSEIPVWPIPNVNLLQNPHFTALEPAWKRAGTSPAGNLINWTLNNSSVTHDKAYSPVGVRYLKTNCGAGSDGRCGGAGVQFIYQDIPIHRFSLGQSYAFGIQAYSTPTYDNKKIQVTIQILDTSGNVLWGDSVQDDAGIYHNISGSVYASSVFVHKLTAIPQKPGAATVRFSFAPLTPQNFDVLNAWLAPWPSPTQSLVTPNSVSPLTASQTAPCPTSGDVLSCPVTFTWNWPQKSGSTLILDTTFTGLFGDDLKMETQTLGGFSGSITKNLSRGGYYLTLWESFGDAGKRQVNNPYQKISVVSQNVPVGGPTGNITATTCTVPTGATTCAFRFSWASANTPQGVRVTSTQQGGSESNMYDDGSPTSYTSGVRMWGAGTHNIKLYDTRTNALLDTKTVTIEAPISLNKLPLGYFDGATCSALWGWSYDPDSSRTSVDVLVYEGNRAITVAKADKSRSDVNTIMKVSGNHGFSIPTPLSLKDGKPHTLKIHAIDSAARGASTVLTSSPRTITCSPPPPVNNPPLGYLDGNCSSFWGWAYDPDAPATSIIVRIEDEKGILYSSVANAAHAGINTAKGITGNHGIYMPFPASLKDGIAHTFRGYGVDTTTNTKVAFVQPQKTMTCPSPTTADSQTANLANAATALSSDTTESSDTFHFTRNLWRGSRGAEVFQLQLRLTTLGFFKGEPSDNYGPLTEEAVKALQAAHNLEPVGSVGEQTRGVLNSLVSR